MKIVFVTENFTGVPGGAERQLSLIASLLAQAGHEVSIVTHEFSRKPPAYPLNDNIELFRLKPARETRSRFRRHVVDGFRWFIQRACKRLGLQRLHPVGFLLWMDVHEPFRLRLEAHLKRHRPDVAIAFLDHSVIALARSRVGYPLRRVASNRLDPKLSYDTRRNARLNPVHFNRNRAAIWRMDRIVTQLPTFAAWYPEALTPRVIVIPNIIEPAQLPPPPQPCVARKAIAVGRLVELKRMDVLVRAWIMVAGTARNWTLEIYGTGPCEASLRDIIAAHGMQEQIILKGHDPDIYARYAQASLMIHPSEVEGFPNVVGEALARGTPIIGFADCAGLNSLIDHGVTGWLVAPGVDRASDLATMLRDILAAPEKLDRMGVHCIDSMRPYAPATVLEKWETMLLQLSDDIARHDSDCALERPTVEQDA